MPKTFSQSYILLARVSARSKKERGMAEKGEKHTKRLSEVAQQA